MLVTAPQPAADMPMAKPACEHYWAYHLHDGLSVRLCQLCHEPDWDDVRREQANPPGVVWLVRDPATCTTCPGDVTAIFPTEPEAAVFTACIPSRRLVIEKWPVPGHE